MPAAAAKRLAYSSVVSGAKLRMLDLNPLLRILAKQKTNRPAREAR